jgi:hypothetical protein
MRGELAQLRQLPALLPSGNRDRSRTAGQDDNQPIQFRHARRLRQRGQERNHRHHHDGDGRQP